MNNVPRLSPDTSIAEGVHVLDYWQWAHSDLLSNLERAIVAEYLVGQALGVTNLLSKLIFRPAFHTQRSSALFSARRPHCRLQMTQRYLLSHARR